jgi:hypothetical protein
MKSKKQQIYKMKGCSYKKKSKKGKKSRKSNKSVKYLGGTSKLNLAYPTDKIFFSKPPALAYTGKGGSNPNAENPVYPNTGGIAKSQEWLNSSIVGGGCGCGGNIQVQSGLQSGGNCGCQQGGNNGLPYGAQLPVMKGIEYPNGLTGDTWGPNFKWPATTDIAGNNNHYALNKYTPDVSRQMIATGASPPFSVGGGKKRRINKNKKSRKQNGGALSNFLFEDLVNVGRQFQYGIGSTYNTLKGYGPPTDPMPWKGQLTRANVLTK